MIAHFKTVIAFALLAITVHLPGEEIRIVDAARINDLGAVQLLVKAGADVNIPQEDGTTALAHAAHLNHPEMVDILLANKADVNARNIYGATALYLAAADADISLIEKLLKAGADPDIGLLSGETPLMVAAERGRLDATRLLLEYDADPNAREHNAGQTALMWAVAEQHGDIADLLVEYEADVLLTTKDGFSPLLFAAQQGNADTVGALLAAGADVNEKVPGSGLTPLMIATVGGYEEVVELLLEMGADPNMMDADGVTPLHEAVKDGLGLDIIRTLIAHGANPNAGINHPRGRARSPTGVSIQGATPLLEAAGVYRLENVKALLKAGADPNISTNTNVTALMMAAGAGTGVNSTADEPPEAVEIVALMVSLGADVNAVGHFGWTPLHLAAYHGYNNVIKYLLEHGGNPNVMDEFGQTPLSISHAIVTEGIGDAYVQTPRSFRRETANLLLSMGAKPLEESGVKIVSRRASE